MKLTLLISLLVTSLFAWSAPLTSTQENQVRQALTKLTNNPDMVMEIQASAVANLAEVLIGGEVVYVTLDGKHLIFKGQLIDLTTRVNLTEQRQMSMRKQLLEQIPQSQMIVYPAAKEKFQLKVFTDVDCGFCRQLHKNLQSYLDAGITIAYLAFPRAGVGSDGYLKMVNVWCAQDRNAAMNAEKLGQGLPLTNTQCNNPVASHYQLGQKLGVQGTPSLFLPNGQALPGLVKADEILKVWQQSQN